MSVKKIIQQSLLLLLWLILIIAIIKMVDRWPSINDWKLMLTQEKIMAAFMFLCCFIVATILRVIRWGLLLKDTIIFKWADVAISFPWLFFLTTFMPFRLGEVSRPLWIRKNGGEGSTALGLLFVERMTDMSMLGLLVGVVFIFSPITPDWVNSFGITFIAFIAFILILMIVLVKPAMQWKEKIQSSLQQSEGIGRHKYFFHIVVRIIEGVGILANPIKLSLVIILSILIWMSMAVAFWIFLQTFDAGLHWTSVIAILAAVNVVGLIAVSPGNVGGYEFVAMVTLIAYGIQSGEALVVATTLHIIALLSVLILGLISKIILVYRGQKLWSMV